MVPSPHIVTKIELLALVETLMEFNSILLEQ
jgi:hypothetical protein